ncbi:hypothetical protein BS50DRAFT_501517 [Corynespora cassiicola Philippines]|uniref:Methyltransferase n=1 Tax=Corynespora cassiicola Philippines TaxID=1448308 RepID=A0A2T2NBK5_CORCC|nr:hypothetical protein BS50DRAFT_501517 [Corynespora cassiicola Philippines]
MHFYDVIEECKGQKPYYSTIPFSAQGALQTNYGSIEKSILVRDIRGHESEFTLEKHGFEVAKHKTKFSDWRNGSRVKKEHFDEIEQFLKEKLNAKKVIIFDHSLRRTDITNANAEKGEEYSAPPSRRPHVDHTLKSALTHVAMEFGEHSEWLKGRIQQINVWRPLFGQVMDHPLAVCDYGTVDRKDLVAVDLVFPHYVSELYKIWHNESQKWYYLDKQMPDEVWLIKMCDSDATEENGVAECCPHAAFKHPKSVPDTRLRESIEMRALVFH